MDPQCWKALQILHRPSFYDAALWPLKSNSNQVNNDHFRMFGQHAGPCRCIIVWNLNCIFDPGATGPGRPAYRAVRLCTRSRSCTRRRSRTKSRSCTGIRCVAPEKNSMAVNFNGPGSSYELSWRLFPKAYSVRGWFMANVRLSGRRAWTATYGAINSAMMLITTELMMGLLWHGFKLQSNITFSATGDRESVTYVPRPDCGVEPIPLLTRSITKEMQKTAD